MKKYIRSRILPHIVEVLKKHKRLTLAIDLMYKDVLRDNSRATKKLAIQARTSKMSIESWFPWGDDREWIIIARECQEKSSIKLKN